MFSATQYFRLKNLFLALFTLASYGKSKYLLIKLDGFEGQIPSAVARQSLYNFPLYSSAMPNPFMASQQVSVPDEPIPVDDDQSKFDSKNKNIETDVATSTPNNSDNTLKGVTGKESEKDFMVENSNKQQNANNNNYNTNSNSNIESSSNKNDNSNYANSNTNSQSINNNNKNENLNSNVVKVEVQSSVNNDGSEKVKNNQNQENGFRGQKEMDDKRDDSGEDIVITATLRRKKGTDIKVEEKSSKRGFRTMMTGPDNEIPATGDTFATKSQGQTEPETCTTNDQCKKAESCASGLKCLNLCKKGFCKHIKVALGCRTDKDCSENFMCVMTACVIKSSKASDATQTGKGFRTLKKLKNSDSEEEEAEESSDAKEKPNKFSKGQRTAVGISSPEIDVDSSEHELESNYETLKKEKL